MIYDPETDSHLKTWLVKNLEPICDAEPGALAEYILALLKHPATEPELRNELIAQLEEFLEKETGNFIDLLFKALRSKSYLPYTNSPPRAPRSNREDSSFISDSGIPIPLDLLSQSQSSSRKRSLEQATDDREYRKGPRTTNDAQVSRYGSGERQWSGQNRGGARASYPRDQSMNGANPQGYSNGRPQQHYVPPDQAKKGVCRDYYNHGYCSRGAYCKYSHGEDAVVPSQLLPLANGMMPFMSMMNNAMFSGAMPNNNGIGSHGGAYDPHERMDMRPRGGMPRAPMVHRQEGPVSSSGELPVIQDLTPHMQVDGDQSQNLRPAPRNGDMYLNAAGMDVDPDSIQQPRQPYHYQRPANNDHPNHQQNGPLKGGRRGGRIFQAPGTFPIDAFPQAELPSTSPMTPSSFTTSAPRPERRTDKTLVVEKIPEEHLSLGAVNDWFKRFGTVTNVAVDVPSAKALVSFSDHDEAHKAWKSEDAVFGNRFVKVFWHRPMGGHGAVGAKMLQASAPLVSRLAAQDGAVAASAAPDAAVVTTTTPVTESVATKKQPRNSTASALAAKQQLLKQQISEQKSLMAKLESADSPEEKKEILGRLRKLGEEMKGSTPTISTTASSPARKTASPGVGRSEDQERIERERLDKELELHAATTALDGEEESTEDLKAKLAKLKAEAASLGLPEADPSYMSYGGGSYHRPYRGRGRGASRGGYYRGRGGPPRTSMKLDNRPKKLLLKGVGLEGVQTVRDWYATTGSLDSVEAIDGGDLVVSFKTRGGAEQGFAKGTSVPTVGTVQVSWYTDLPSTSRQQSHQPSHPQDTTNREVGEKPRTENVPSAAHEAEEELVASGWGDDGEDGMGLL